MKRPSDVATWVLSPDLMELGDRRSVTPNTLSVSDALDHARTMPSDSVDLVVFSPPYDGVRDYRGEWTVDLPALGAELLRVVKDGCFAVIVMGDGTKDQRKSMTTFRTAVAWEDAGWACFEHVIYSRDGRPGAWWATRFRVDHEYVLIFYKGKRPRPTTRRRTPMADSAGRGPSRSKMGHCCFAGCTLVTCGGCGEQRCVQEFHICPPCHCWPDYSTPDAPSLDANPECPRHRDEIAERDALTHTGEEPF